MKISYLLLLIVLLPFTAVVCAQIPPTLQFKIDSADKALARHPRTDTTRARMLINEARMISNSGQYDKALPYFDQAFAISEKINWQLGQCFTRRCMAITYRAKKEYNKSVDCAKEAISIAKKAKIDSVKFDGQYQLGLTLYSQQKYTEAITLFLPVADYGFKAKNHRQATSPLVSVADSYYLLKDEKNGDSYYKKALVVSDILNTRLEKIKFDRVIASRYANRGKNDKVFEIISQQMKLFLPSEANLDHLDALDFLGFYYLYNHNTEKALTYYLKSSQIKEKMNLPNSIALSYVDIGTVYTIIDDSKKAEEYFLRAEKILGSGNLIGFAKNRYTGLLVQLALTEYTLHKYEQALAYLKKISIPNPALNDTTIKAYTEILNAAKANRDKNYSASVTALQKLEAMKITDPNALSGYNSMYGEFLIYAPDSVLTNHHIPLNNRYEKGIELMKKGVNILIKNFSRDGAINAYKILTAGYEKIKDYKNAYITFKDYTTFRDSSLEAAHEKDIREKFGEFAFLKKEDSLKFQQQLISEKLKQQTLLSGKQQQDLLINRQKLALANRAKDLERLKFLKTQAGLQAEQSARKANIQQLKATQKEKELANTTVQLQKTEISAKKTQSYYLLGGIAALLGLSFFIAQNYNNQRRSNKQIQAEKQRSETLLLNILPEDVAEELKEKGSADARLFDEVTVLFTDFVNFTTISEMLTPQQLVDELHTCFKGFDDIVTKHNIEKIKTIGDAYLAVAGLPNADANHAQNAVKAAMDITAFIKQRKDKMGDKTFDVRVGIHSGSVVAGIVGVKKFAYDIWGDTVNTAARMEQSSEPGKINVSEKTYELIKDKFTFSYRGEIAAKNKGKLKMYFAEV